MVGDLEVALHLEARIGVNRGEVVRLWISILVGMMTRATTITTTIFEGRNQDVS